MDVLIVSKTHMSNAACVGGLTLEGNRNIRLLNPGNHNQPTDTDFQIGDIWRIDFKSRAHVHAPHVEDVVIASRLFVGRVDNMQGFLTERNIVNWIGHIDSLFDGLLNWTNSGAGYIPVDGEMPAASVGFWIADKNLVRVTFENSKTRFRYPNGGFYRNVRFVGYQDTIQEIPTGTILRVSLSRIFPSAGSGIDKPTGFYLQLSGWYLNA